MNSNLVGGPIPDIPGPREHRVPLGTNLMNSVENWYNNSNSYLAHGVRSTVGAVQQWDKESRERGEDNPFFRAIDSAAKSELGQVVTSIGPTGADDLVGIAAYEAGEAGVIDPRLAGVAGLLTGLTVTNKKFLSKGAEQGFAAAKHGDWLSSYEKRRTKLLAQVQEKGEKANFITSNNAGPEKTYKHLLDKRNNDLSVGPTNLDDNAEVFGTTARKREKQQLGEMTGQKLEDHHWFSKMESYAFVKKMGEVGDMDDLANMFLWVEEMGTVMGGRKKGLTMIDKYPHVGSGHSRRIKEGLEVKEDVLTERISKATNANEVMELMADHLKNNVDVSTKDFEMIQSRWKTLLEQHGGDRKLARADLKEGLVGVPYGGGK